MFKWNNIKLINNRLCKLINKMRASKKLSFYYLIFGLSFASLILCLFAIMSNIESSTSHLETKLWRRSLEDIVDQPYSLKIAEMKDQRVDFLNELTQFFYNFYENTIIYKTKLSNFMLKRKTVLRRFERTGIEVFDLAVLPNDLLENYNMKSQTGNFEGTELSVRQFPFSRVLTFKAPDFGRFVSIGERNDVYLLCSARIRLTSNEKSVVVQARITESSENKDKASFLHFKLHRFQPTVIQLHRILKIRDLRVAKIMVGGIATNNLEIDNVEAVCMSFKDVRAI